MKKLALRTMAFVLIFPFYSIAENESNWYLGANVGYTSYDDIDDNATAFSIDIGYAFTENWALQAGYTDFGDVSELGVDAGSSGFIIKAVGILPLNDNFDLLAQAGVGFINSDADATIDTSIGPIDIEVEDSSTEFVAGVGVKYNFSQNASLKLVYDFYDGANIPSLGVQFNF